MLWLQKNTLFNYKQISQKRSKIKKRNKCRDVFISSSPEHLVRVMKLQELEMRPQLSVSGDQSLFLLSYSVVGAPKCAVLVAAGPIISLHLRWVCGRASAVTQSRRLDWGCPLESRNVDTSASRKREAGSREEKVQSEEVWVQDGHESQRGRQKFFWTQLTPNRELLCFAGDRRTLCVGFPDGLQWRLKTEGDSVFKTSWTSGLWWLLLRLRIWRTIKMLKCKVGSFSCCLGVTSLLLLQVSLTDPSWRSVHFIHSFLLS